MHKTLIIISLCLGSLVFTHAQILVNEPINFKDSLNIFELVEYRVDNFVCNDTVKTIYEIDALGRKKKMTQYFRNRLQKEVIYLESDSSKLFAKKVEKNYNISTAEIEEELNHYYYYDNNENIKEHVIKNETDSIIEKTLYSYNDQNNVDTLVYKIVQSKWTKSQPPGTKEIFKYDIDKNLVFKTTKKPNKRRSKTREYTFIKQKVKPIDNNLTLEIKQNDKDQKGRIEYIFDQLGNVISFKQFATFPPKKGKKEKEMQLCTFKFDIKYK